MWSGPSSRSINYGLPPEMGMVGLRDVFVVAPASSFHHNNHHPHHHLHHNLNHDPNLISDHSLNGSNPATALGVGVGVGVIPLLTAAPCLGPSHLDEATEANALGSSSAAARSRNGGIQLWQSQAQQAAAVSAAQTQLHPHFFKKPSIHDHGNSEIGGNLVIQSGGGGGINVGSGSTSSSTATCQDCGNQAKKDCTHRRCRTCCKSRGFDCSTHVKSTWVPAARRRERQLMTSAGPGGGTGPGSSGSTSGAKKPRLIASQTTSHTSTSNTTPPRSFDTSSSHQDASFKETLPGQVRAPAVFKCVRVTAVEDGEDEYAYQAVVKIGGHVFKGFLYDQGVETTTRDNSTFPNLSELHLGGGGGRNGASSSSPMLDPSDVYAASTSGLLGGSTYGNPIN
ncbi:protein LATERAL ROOT PRIMORDIUM 1-like [Cannabis sativa]|uniref:protein LATERAL ROOT PRIMORDIUM 1-like n=1 Tax=Cannabis sativa TaxID=3483 RepID=UPI0029CA15F3|nr:protein LATERAL ROOT PRIMORDIUM 1-like [Cannabis sativa]